MIKHVVMFKLADKSRLPELKQAIASMRGQIEVLQDLEIGVDFMGSERSMDLMIITLFASKEDLKTYGAHPKHQPVLALVKQLCTEVRACDYEI